jgi:phosphoenolpyruvate synthase/pyruvate phosphate dikinase
VSPAARHRGEPPDLSFLPLGQGETQDPALAGAKAATLSRLRQAFPHRVPPAWVLPAHSVSALAADGGSEERPTLESLRAALKRALEGMTSTSYAVRSSGLDEDSPQHSFAGQYRTILGVRGESSLAEAICECARSWSAPHIDAYRRLAGTLDQGPPAIFVQEMVPAERAGVAFTSNPVSGGDEVVIDAGYGLGDLVVGGEITPDELGVDGSGKVLWEKIGGKRRMSVLTANGVVQIPIPCAFRQRLSLSPPQISAVAEAAELCATTLGYHADVEWAIADGEVLVLQARPITAAAFGRRGEP